MLEEIVPIQHERHGQKKIKPIERYDFAKSINVASVLINEFFQAAAIYPIVFIEDQENDMFKPVVLLGIKENENLFVDSEGKWKASYVPAILQRYPFALATTDEENKYTICVDEKSELLNDEEGEDLFTSEGEPGEVLERVKQKLSELQQMEEITKQFCKEMQEKNLFTPFNISLRDQEGVRNLTGSYVINEQRLQNVSDNFFLELRRRNILPAIYAHLVSLNQMERLSKLSTEVTHQ